MKTKCPDCCYPEIVNSDACGCCEGVEAITPLPTANRPGLSKLVYRIGTHASFLETMMARLSSSDYPELSGLTSRDDADPSIALLDAWATVADVLTFYQERIANEGYLRSATERRSILELARLVGYKLRPGVAASVFLAYTLDEKMKDEVTIPAGSRAQSIPGPDELPQSFETSEDLKARSKWNNLKPRMTQPQNSETIFEDLNKEYGRVYLKGINTNLKPNDPLLIDVGSGTPAFYRVTEVTTDADADRTLVKFRSSDGLTATEGPEENLVNAVQLIKDLTLRPSLQPRNTFRLNRKLKDQFSQKAETGYRTVGSFSPQLRETLPLAAANAKVTTESKLKVYALRVEAPLFGHNAPKRTRIKKEDGEIEIIGDWPIIEEVRDFSIVAHDGTIRIGHEEEDVIYLDNRYNNILRDSWIVVETPDTTRLTNKNRIIVKVNNIEVSLTRSKYSVTAPTTRIELENEKWIELVDPDNPPNLKAPSRPNIDDDFDAVRSTIVYAQSEQLELAEEPIQEPVGQCKTESNEELGNINIDKPIELDGFYEGLESGRWVIVSGERDISGTSGVRFSELAMLASVTQTVSTMPQGVSTVSTDTTGTDQKQVRAGEKVHTFIKLAEKLQYCFKRDTITIYGNVAKTTHGETRQEVQGSGDGSKAMQSFELKQFPLTYVSASNPTGVDSTLKLIVNNMEWHETGSLAGLQATDRNFITKTDDEDKTTVTFGNGREGARLPTGVENIKAQYRNGIGKSGNVKTEQISLLVSKPLGVKEVINPLRASGGADRENRDRARKNAPLAVKALDRLVSVQDYEDFARIYAGIGKAHAVEMTDGRRQIVHVTIAGADDIPIDETSDLFMNLRQALHDSGDPFQPIRLAVRELMMIVISARVRILPDYQWEPVVVLVRDALLNAFGFESRELGQDVLLSEVISVMQAVRGVAYVDVDTFGGVPEKQADELVPGERRLLIPEEIAGRVQELISASEEMNRPEARLRVNLADFEQGAIRPAQLAFLTPEVPETLILNRIE